MTADASDGAALPPDGLPERFGPYHVLRRLGRGGMGTVYLARDTRLDRPVALKVCHLDNHPQALERFRREARAAAALRHPNLCPVYEYDVRDGIPYLVMAYIGGGTLADRLQKHGPLPQREAALLVLRLALAMDVAHRQGVVHRDLKPANVALDERGEPVILDFGLARQAGGPGTRLTHLGSVLGTPAYMAPEQLRGDPAAAGRAGDVYSLGAVLYELLTGEPPFVGPTAAVLAQVLCAEPTPPSRLRPGLDPRLEACCLRALAKEPSRRHADMAAFSAALELALPAAGPIPAAETMLPHATAPVAIPVLVAEPADTAAGSTRPRRHDPHPARRAPRAVPATPTVQRWRPRDLIGPLVLGGAAAVLVAGCLVGWALWQRGGPPGRAAGDPGAALGTTGLEPADAQPTAVVEQFKPLARLRLRLPPTSRVFLQPGTGIPLRVELERQGCDGPVRLRTDDLPPGLLPASLELAAGATAGHIRLAAAADAAPTDWLACLVAEADDARAEARFRITLGTPLPPLVVNSIGMRLALVPAGRFRMGSPKTERDRSENEEEHDVTITKPYYLAICEVTQDQYEQVVKTNPSHFNRDNGGGPDCPVESVTWVDATAFCRALSALPAELRARRAYRLPTEAEWERACRGGDLANSAFHLGDHLSSEQANFDGGHPYGGAAPGPYLRRTTPVGRYTVPTGLDFCDMHGNVAEWCADWYGWGYYKESPPDDPPGPADGRHRVVRGGAWNSEGWKCRSACRRDLDPAYRGSDVGFRVVLDVPPGGP